MMLVNNGMKTWKEGRDLKKNNISNIFNHVFLVCNFFPYNLLLLDHEILEDCLGKRKANTT